MGFFGDSGFAASEEVADVLEEIGYRAPTKIQQRALPLVRGGGSIVALSETGTGKTACFSIPIVETLAEDLYGVCALILTPTRELALQTKTQLDLLGDRFHVQSLVICGGLALCGQHTALLRRPHVVVGTARRLATVLEVSEVARVFSKTRYLVLDEADLLVSGSQSRDVLRVLSRLPGSCQLLLFSATQIDPGKGGARVEGAVEELWKRILDKSPAMVDMRAQSTPAEIAQEYAVVHWRAKDAHLVRLLQGEYSGERAIVFVNKSSTCVILSGILARLGIKAAGLCGAMEQQARIEALERFRNGQADVLVSTDISSRGLDIRDVKHVVNFDVPHDFADYVHRVGRTGRAGRKGHSLSLVENRDLPRMEAIAERLSGALRRITLAEITDLRMLNKVTTQRELVVAHVMWEREEKEKEKAGWKEERKEGGPRDDKLNK